MRILFCGDAFPAARPRLAQRIRRDEDELVVCRGDGIRAALDGVDMVIPFMCRIDAALMDAGRFRLIQQWGAGLEGIDLPAAKQRGICVSNGPATWN